MEYNIKMEFPKKNLAKVGFLLLLGVLMTTSLVYAQNIDTHPPCDPAGGKVCNPIDPINSLPQLIKIFLTGALKIGIPVIALAIIYCGFLFVEARGNSEKLSKAKEALLYTVIGAAILLGSW